MIIDSKLTDEQNIMLIILDKLDWSAEAANLAVEFIEGNELRQRLFNVYFDKSDSADDVMQRTKEAVEQAKEALKLFPVI